MIPAKINTCSFSMSGRKAIERGFGQLNLHSKTHHYFLRRRNLSVEKIKYPAPEEQPRTANIMIDIYCDADR
jgi:hypothetical protein